MVPDIRRRTGAPGGPRHAALRCSYDGGLCDWLPAMNWLDHLLPKPAQKASTARPAALAPRPAADLPGLRRALENAVEDEQRRRCAAALGRALADAALEPPPGDGPEVLAAAASHATDKAYALACAARVQTDVLLAEVAQHGRFAELRLAAAERISDGPTLDRLARHSRNRDKGVYRHCTEVLRQRRDAQRRTQRDASIAAALRGLLASAPLSVTRLLELERELQGGKDGAAATPMAAECRELLDRANARLLEEAAALRGQQGLVAGVAELARQVRAPQWPQAEQRARWRQELDALRQVRAGLPPWLAVLGSSRAVDPLLDELDTVLGALEEDARRLDHWDRLLAQRAPDGDAPPYPDHPGARADLLARVAAARPADPGANPPSLGAEGSAALDAAPLPPAPSADAPAPLHAGSAVHPPPERRPGRTARPAPDLDALRDRVAELEQAIDDGQLAQAEVAAQRLKAAAGSAAIDGRLDARLQRAQARLGQLRGWAQWGASKQREQLITAAQELLAAAPEVEHLTVAIPALREQWKALNAQGPASRGQWETFDRALEQAYRPVAAHRAQEAARRAEARAGKEALLAGWDSAVAAHDWTRPDLVALDALRQQMLRSWRDAPAAGFRDERALRRRLDALLATLDEGIGAARARVLEQREALIEAVQALAGAADLRQATAQAKELQERWQREAAAARLPRGDEQKLWKRFRGACDVVFQRRDGLRAEEAAQRQQRLQAREQKLSALAAALESSEAGALQRAVAQFRSEWEPVRGGSGDAPDAQDRRARELLQRAQQRTASLRQAAYRAQLTALARPGAAAVDDDEAALAAGRRAREDLLLELEMALDLPSPPSSADARRRRQVALLQARFRGGAAAAGTPEELLGRLQAIGAPVDAQIERRIDAVVERLVQRHGAAGSGHSS